MKILFLPFFLLFSLFCPHADAQNEQAFHVEIALSAEMNDSLPALGGNIVYKIKNQTGTTFNSIFFHLYDNAFQPESHYHDLLKSQGKTIVFGKNERLKRGTDCENIRVNHREVRFKTDNTILEIFLNAPFSPGDSLLTEIDFRTWYDKDGNLRRRNKFYEAWGQKHFNGVHFYPVLCPYDAKGWHTDQHLDKEFYAFFASWDVKLTFPDDYILDASGILLNEKTVLPDSLAQIIDLKNFINNKPNEKPSLILTRSGKKTWHYKAKDLHNFAYTASPAYRRAKINLPETEIIILVKEPHAALWRQTPDAVRYLVLRYGAKIGKYPYPKLIIADAAEGFECGMTALVSGQYPYHIPLITHELAHQWFQGAVGNNERRYAFMDEGFAEFLTLKMLTELNGGDIQARSHRKNFVKPYLRDYSLLFGRVNYPYLLNFWNGFDAPLKTFASSFRGGIRHEGGYGLTYHKGALMLLQLEMMLGKEKFWAMLAAYFEKFRFKNPYPEDFQKHVSEFAANDFAWFFEQWYEGNQYTDYAIKKVKKERSNEQKFQYTLSLRRRGTARAAFSLEAEGVSGKKYRFFVPVSYSGYEAQGEILPVWYGFGKFLNREYQVKLTFEEKIKRFEIDAEGILPDVRRDNNIFESRFFPAFQPFLALKNPPAARQTEHHFYPDFWYNRLDGVQAGAHFRGNFLGDVRQYRATFWVNTRFFYAEDRRKLPFWSPFSFKFFISGKLSAEIPPAKYFFENQFNGNFYDQKIGLSYTFARKNIGQSVFSVFSVAHKLLSSPKNNEYALQPELWSGKTHSLAEFVLQNHFGQKKMRSVFRNEIRTPFLASEAQYSFFQSDFRSRYAGKKMQFSFRITMRAGFGEHPSETALYLYGDNPEGMTTSRLTRSRMSMQTQELRFSNRLLPFHQGGGLNVRGYTGYAFGRDDGIYFGKSGGAVNAEWDFGDIFAPRSAFLKKYFHTDLYAFFDAAKIFRGEKEQFAADAGVGIAFHFKLYEEDDSPFIFRIDAPFWLSDAYPDGKNWRFRYVFGVGRAF